MVHLGNTGRIAILIQNPPDDLAVWNRYLPLLVYPRLTGAGDDGSNEDVDATEQSDTGVPLETLLV
jgi:hypothetical protein